MTPRTPGRRTASRALVALGSVALALGATACSAAGDPTAAAVVDGRVISEADVQTVVAELPPEVTGGQPLPPGQVLQIFLVADIIEDVAREYTGVISEEVAREGLLARDLQAGREPVDYSDATLEIIALDLMVQNILQTDLALPEYQERVIERQQGDDVTINPRYGRITEDNGFQFSVFTHDWLVEPPVDAQPSEPAVSED
jgi:hypothetical protein